MGKDAILGKKRSVNLQPTLPGMDKVERVRAPKEKTTKPKTGLGEEIRQGNIPMIMTAPELIKHYDLGDALMDDTETSEGKTPRRRSREKNMMSRKLRESKTGPEDYSHNPRKDTSTPSLYESIAEKGVTDPIHVDLGLPAHPWSNSQWSMRNDKLPVVRDGHHRLAAMRNLHPKQFIPIEYT